MTVINTNIKALVAQDSARQVNLKLATAMERLSTGLRINSAKDDAAGLAISERMNSQVRGLGMAIKNANDGLSMAQTADGAYGEVTSMLQRMRELAVQAATGSMSSLDRKSLQLEIDELKSEIDNVAKTTQFNGINLLDGTAQNITLQVGANEGNTMKIGFNSVLAKDIGAGLTPALTSLGGDAEVFDGFGAADLVINGVLVNTSLASDDALSFAKNEASAIAKVTSINRVTNESGVYARVNETRVIGSAMTPATGTGSISINGVSTASVNVGADGQMSRAALVRAINDIAKQTGVTAYDTGDNDQGIQLIADDGRNITVTFTEESGTFDSTTTGISGTEPGASATFVGTFSLYTQSGKPIVIDHGIGGDITGTGLRMGSYQPDIAAMATLERSGTGSFVGAHAPLSAGSAPASSSVGVLNGDTLVINGYSIPAARTTDDTASVSTSASVKAASAIAIAAAINRKTDLHGVTAKANPNVIRAETATNFSAGGNGSINLNGVTISLSTASRNAVLERVNAYTGQTGVVAKSYGEGIELVAEDGRNITLATTSNLSAANLGLAGVAIGQSSSTTVVTAGNANAFYGTVSLTSEKIFVVTRGSEGGTAGDDNFQALGFREGSFGGSDKGQKIAEVDVSTQAGASLAISTISDALEDVLAAQAKSGAYQNRLDAVISVLSETVENTTAARSRVQDADYALEAANLAKAQIIAQAANAMLAQANQSQQSVLSLLQG
jgi:flagellin